MNNLKLSAETTLQLVRDLSEHKIRKDPTCNFKPKREMPKATEYMLKAFTRQKQFGHDKIGKKFVNFMSGKSAVLLSQTALGNYLIGWGEGNNSVITERQLKSEFNELEAEV